MSISIWIATALTSIGGLPLSGSSPSKGLGAWAPAIDPLWLGVLEAGVNSCPPAPPGWDLLTNPGPPFERYCAYEAVFRPHEPRPNPADLNHPSLQGLSGASVGRVRPQPTGTLSAGGPTPMSTAMGPHLWNYFAQRVELPARPIWVGPPSVRLAIVDTSPRRSTAPNSLHAPTLGGIAEALACPSSGPCPLEVSYELALPRKKRGVVDRVNGGYYGTLWELAQGIAKATEHARLDGIQRLVINLSLGFEPAGYSSWPAQHLGHINGNSTLPAPLRAVHAALVFARCQGAVVLAASGNDDFGEKDRTGPLLPAAWQRHSSPTPTQCKTFPGGLGIKARPHGPLVTAVGGIDHRRKALENARPRSTPALVAPGSGAVSPKGASSVLTGTSVSTLVASTAVALAWAQRPSVTAQAALDMVAASARPLQWRASFCPGKSTCPKVRRVSLCRAQAKACGDDPSCDTGACPADVETAAPSWPQGMLTIGGLAALGGGVPSSWLMGAPQKVASCTSSPVRAPMGWRTRTGCPLGRRVAARELDTGPQPLDPMCPACFVFQTPANILMAMDLSPFVPGGAMHDVHLVLSNGVGSERFALPGPFGAGHNEVFVLSPPTLVGPVDEVWLQYVVYENGQPFLMGEPLILE